MNICSNERYCLVTPDSGTTFMTMPTWAFQKVNKLLPNKTPCQSDKDFPTLSYVL